MISLLLRIISAGILGFPVTAVVAGQPQPALGAAVSAMVLGSIGYGLGITLFIAALRDLGAARTRRRKRLAKHRHMEAP